MISFSPMSPWWRALYGGLGKGIALHEKGEVPLHVMGAGLLVALLTVGSLLIGCCLWANPAEGDHGNSSAAAAGASHTGAASGRGAGDSAAAEQDLLKYAVD